MRPNRHRTNVNDRLARVRMAIGISVITMVSMASATPARAQSFNSGSDGSDGIYAPSGPAGTVIVFDPAQFRGSQVAANIFNFTSITIPVGVTVRLSSILINGPIVWLAQGDINIAGTVDLSGANGYDINGNPFARVPSQPGPGGYPGGVGNTSAQPSTPGNGPGGGCSDCINVFNFGKAGRGGTFAGNQFLIPLIGGSGGGGSTSPTGAGAGGGAILIASSTKIVISGAIDANGGNAGTQSFWGQTAGGGSGGAVRLVSNMITGSGTSVTVAGGSSGQGTSGGAGLVRVEAYSISGVPGLQSAPFPLLIPTNGPATAKVISIGGVLINANPGTFPDLSINTASAVPVVIQTHNVPVSAAISLTILNENNVPDTVIQAPPLGNCDQNNFCTTTVNVVFPFGASRGLTKVSWTQ